MIRPPMSPSTPPSWDECVQLLNHLPQMPIGRRQEAIELLARNPSPWIRQQALHMGAALLPDQQLVEFLRDEADDVRRSMGVEILKLKGAKALPLAITLLEDGDSDVALMAVLVIEALKDPRALEPLRASLKKEDPNMVQAAIVALGHLGDERLIPDLLPFLSGDPWLSMAAVQALGDLRSPKAIRHLKRFLPDLMLGTLAAEALARIGGREAYKTLAAHWMHYRDQLDQEMILGFLAHVAEGLCGKLPAINGFLSAIRRVLDDSNENVRLAGAKILLAAGDGPSLPRALDALAACSTLPAALPSCLSRRADLIPSLLARQGMLYGWGLQLAALHAGRLPAEVLTPALSNAEARDRLEMVVPILMKTRGQTLAGSLLDLYLSLPPTARPALVPALLKYRKGLTPMIQDGTVPAEDDRLILTAVLRGGGDAIAGRLGKLPPIALCSALEQMTGRPALLRRIPWISLLDSDPASYAPAAAHAAVLGGLRELLPTLRRTLQTAPHPDVVRSLGELGDRESVPALASLLTEAPPFMKALVLETLGRIGGPEARDLLRRSIGTLHAPQLKTAYRALARCASDEDAPLFRAGASHADWMIRLACAEALSRFPTPENMSVLTTLASDPVAIVAQRAGSALEA